MPVAANISRDYSFPLILRPAKMDYHYGNSGGCMTKLNELANLGQSVWLDYIRRSFILSGELKKLIDLGIRGMTSNPSIFEKAIIGSTTSDTQKPGEYDQDLKRLILDGKTPLEIYESLAIEDIQMVADLLRPLYDASHGGDGYVSLEVDPTLANETQATLEEAQRLWSKVNRPNLMVKIPATREGLAAITGATAAGINVNITLIFSLLRYQEVMDAFLKGLEQRLVAGQRIDHIASVASFFVSRVDTKVDKKLDEIVHEEGPRTELAAQLLGKAAVANAKLAYSLYEEVFSSPRFLALKEHGARPQRPLWASTSTKNPAYSDILYVQELIGPDTVNTVPQATMDAFLDHGEVRQTIHHGLEQANQHIQALESLGISMDQVTLELETEGVNSFIESFLTLIGSIEKRQNEILGQNQPVVFQLRRNRAMADAALSDIARNNLLPRIWREDYTVWNPKPAEISNRLGWLHSYEDIQMKLGQINAIVDTVRDAGYTHALVLGMGGSSLAPDLFGKTFLSHESPALRVEVLDSTVPARILSYANRLDPAKCLFIVSTKSGTTEETLSFFKYFYNWTVNSLGEKNAGDHFIAITDPGSKLIELARTYHFRATFTNDPNIGGRYSALSHFGLVPAAFAGVNLGTLLDRAAWMADQCKASVEIARNPAAYLGAALGQLANAGIDKVTFFLSPQIASFGDWVEQLIAESTGKDGRGILPVVGENPGVPESYSSDRLFVHIHLHGDATHENTVASLEAAGFPVIRLVLKDIYDLGGQFFLWELATAVAGQRLGIQPFDQPNVEAAKVLARQKVAAYKQTGHLPEIQPAIEIDGMAIFGELTGKSPVDCLIEFISRAQPGDYIALQAYIPPTPESEVALRVLRETLREKTRLATTLGFGPRFLHSTGQLHKGDRGNGLFIQITADDEQDVPIPDQAGRPESSITFGVLKMAQALGDFQALSDTGRRVMRIHLRKRTSDQLTNLSKSILD
jgi:transaldolase/glucose-6-phosphate isomerase